MNFKTKTYLKNKKGAVLIVVITAIVFLAIIVQQIGFDSYVEFKNGIGRYHSLKAYYSAKSGLELSLLKVLLYKKIKHETKKLGENPMIESITGALNTQLNTLWIEPSRWPYLPPEDLDDIRKTELQNITQESLFDEASYSAYVENEGAKLDINALASPHPEVRKWAQETLYNLLSQIRNKNEAIEEKYSENDLQQIIQNTADAFNPAQDFFSEVMPQGAIMDIQDLKLIEGLEPDLIHPLLPYITLYGEEGVYLQFASAFLIESLHERLDEKTALEIFKAIREQNLSFSNFKEAENFFTSLGLDFMLEKYFTQNDSTLTLARLVFNFDAMPKNFRITSFGFFGDIERSLTAVLYDPTLISRSFKLFEAKKKSSDYSPPTNPLQADPPPSRHTAPKQGSNFIIHFREI